MMNKLKLRIFLSSPGDVGDERRMALRVMERLQGEFAAVLVLEPIVWEHEPVRATSTFQDQIPEPAKADILVCVLWSRLGTRLPGDFKRPDGTVYDSGTAFELETALAAFKNLGHPDILVYRKTAPPLFDVSNREERELRSQQWDQLSDYLKHWFFNPDGSFKAGFTQFARLDEFEEQLERHLRKLIEERLREENISLAGAASALPTWLKGSPFRGLAAFDVEHAEIFHGRTRAIAEAKDRLQRRAAERLGEDGQAESGTAFLLITGMSGSGKSSLVRAGLIPAITTPGAVEGIGLWRYAIVRPAEAADPVAALAAKLYGKSALPELAQGDFTPETLADLMARMPQQGVGPLRRALERAAEALMRQEKLAKPPAARLLILVDQLEELFTDERFDEETRNRFAVLLETLATSGLVWIVATLRSDFYHRCQEIPTLARLKDGTGTYDLLPPQGPEIAQMIRGPARAAGISFEESATEGGLDDVLQQAAARSPASLPLLSFVLDELYNACGDSRRLTFAAYAALGGLEGAIAKRADDVVNALPARVQAALPALLRALITLARDDGLATARTVLKRQAVQDPAAEALVAALIEARLLVTGGEGEDTVLRVTHEALLTRWPRARQIITDNREFLQARARVQGDCERWLDEQRNPEELLPSGKRLIEAREVLLTRRGELDPALVEYIEASLAAEAAREAAKQAEARRKLRRTQMAAAIGLVLALIAGVGAYFGITGQQEAELQAAEAQKQRAFAEEQAEEAQRQRAFAEEQANEAEKQRGIAEEQAEEARKAETLAEEQRALAEERAEEARRNLTEVLRFQSKTLALESRRQTGEGNAILGELLALEALPKPGDTTERPYVEEAEAALKVALAAQKGLAVYSHYEQVNAVHVSPDGKRLVTGSTDFTARIWDLFAATPQATLRGHTGPVWSAQFSPDGSRIATSSDDGTARIWDAVTGEELVRMEGHEGTVWTAAFSPDGRRLLTLGADNTARVWEVATGRPVAVGPRRDRGLSEALFSPDGSKVLQGAYDGFAEVWDAQSGQVLATVGGDYTGGITWVGWSPDGARFATADVGGAAEVWNTDDGSFALGLYGRHQGEVTRVAFSPGGETIATGDQSGVVHLWNARSGSYIYGLRRHGCHEAADGARECRIWGIEYSPDSLYIATVGQDRTLVLWDTYTREALSVLEQGGSVISAAAFTPDSQRIVTSAWDGNARLWDVGNGPAKAVLGRRAPWMTEVAFTPDNKKLAIGSGNEGVLMLFDTADGGWIDTLPYHNNEITHIEFSRDGRWMLTTSYDYSAAVWDMSLADRKENPEPLVATQAIFHEGEVLNGSFSPDATLFVTASMDGTAKIVETETGRELQRLAGHGRRVNAAIFSPDGKRVVTASDDALAMVWDVATGQPLLTLEGHDSWVNMANFSPDGRSIATVSSDGYVGLWDAASGELLDAWQAFEYDVWYVAFSPDGKRLAVAGKGGGVLYDLETRQELARLPHEQQAYEVHFSPDGTKLLTVDEKGVGILWSAKDGKQILRLEGHAAPIYAAAWSSNGGQIATVSEDGNARLWNPVSGEALQVIQNFEDQFWDVSFSPDGRWLAGGGYVNLSIWNSQTGRREWLLPGHRDYIVRVVFSPDGQRLITASVDGTALLRDTQSWNTVSTISHYSAVYDAQFSGDSQRLVTVDQDGRVAVWDGKTGDLITLLEGHTKRVNSGRFDPVDNTRLVTGSDDGTAIVWDTTSGKPLLTLAGHTDWVNEAIYSPDGKFIATASADRTARLWDARTGAHLVTFDGHLKELWNAAFSPDGRLLATASSDGTARVWDVSTGKEIFALPAPASIVNRVVFSPEGDHLVTVSNDQTARVWDSRTGVLVTSLVGHTGTILDVEFSPDGRELATGAKDGRARVWRVFTGTALVDWARASVPRQLSVAERERFSLPPE